MYDETNRTITPKKLAGSGQQSLSCCRLCTSKEKHAKRVLHGELMMPAAFNARSSSRRPMLCTSGASHHVDTHKPWSDALVTEPLIHHNLLIQTTTTRPTCRAFQINAHTGSVNSLFGLHPCPHLQAVCDVCVHITCTHDPAFQTGVAESHTSVDMIHDTRDKSQQMDKITKKGGSQVPQQCLFVVRRTAAKQTSTPIPTQ